MSTWFLDSELSTCYCTIGSALKLETRYVYAMLLLQLRHFVFVL